MSKKLLSCAVLSALLLPLTAQAEEINPLDTVYVSAQQDVRQGGYIYTTSRLGVLGNQSVMKIPFTQVSMTEKSVNDFATPALPLQQVLINQPSVQLASNSPMYSDFSVRGIGMNGTHVYFNNVPSLFSQFRTPPTHMIGRVDLMVGPASALNGTAASSNGTNSGKSAAPGVMNILSKQATEAPVKTVTFNFTSKKNLGAYFDVGQRIGENQNWGVRIYGGLLGGQLALDGSGKDEKTIGVNIDHKSEKQRTNFFAGHIDLRVDGSQRWFKTSANVMPKAPNHHMDYDFPETTKRAHWYVFTLNHEYDLANGWTAFFNAGASAWSGSKYNLNAAIEFDAKGNIIKTTPNLMNEIAENKYYQIGVRGEIQSGDIHHALSVSFDQSKMSYWRTSIPGADNSVEGNLYTGIIFKDNFYPLPVSDKRAWSYDEKNRSFTINDLMTYGKWNVLVGATKRIGKLHSTSENINNNNTLPTFGVTYRPNENVSIYAGHSQSFSRGQMVSDKKYQNYGKVLDPVRQKQTEFGVKYNSGSWLGTVAYFQIDQGNFIDETFAGDAKKSLVQDGLNEYDGFEVALNGKVAERLTLQAGFMYLDAKRAATTGGKKDGWFVHGASKYTAVLGATYELDENVELLGRIKYNSSARINDGGGEIPAYTLVDLGVNWNTTWNNYPVKVHAMIYNAFDKSAWTGRSGSTTFGLTWPRTYTIGATFEF